MSEFKSSQDVTMVKSHEQILKNFVMPYEDSMLGNSASTAVDVIEIATAHWNYVSGILVAHGVKPDSLLLNACKYHYITAFEHGWKHAIEARTEAGYIFCEGKGK